VTRARLRLYLSGHAPTDEKQGTARPASGSLLDLLWPAVREEFAAAVAADNPGDLAPTADAPLRMLWHRLPADFQPAPMPVLPVPQSLTRALAETATGAVEFSWVGPLARAAGTVMH